MRQSIKNVHSRRVLPKIAQSIVAGLLSLAVVSSQTTLHGADPEDKQSRYAIKDLDGHFPFTVPASKDAWLVRADELRTQLEIALGILPKPTMAPLKAVSHSSREMDGYSIEKVYFESLPGFYVTGSLFVPSGDKRKEKMPAVLCPHGHWQNGRFYWCPDNEVAQLLATGAERFESAARNHMQARCVQLARMGCVVFQYDMIGYADSQQINFDRGHRFGLAGPNPAVKENHWLLYSPQAEGHLQSIMALQTINSMQAFEYLASRKDVDPKKIAITGASGGGTQSFIGAAVEPRMAGAFPAVMVSTGMQGGCTCENASCLRVDTGNVEIAALIAPRPLGMTAADDWTRTMPRDGFPELKKLYGLFGAEKNVSLFPALHFPHNYNHVSRVSMYGFMNRLFELGLPEPILEKDFDVLPASELSVWDADHPRPESGVEFESKLLQTWAEDTAKTLSANPKLRSTGWKSLLEPANRIAKTLKLSAPKTTGKIETIEVRNADDKVVGEIKLVANDTSGTLEIVDFNEAQKASIVTKNTLLLTDAWGIDADSEQSLVRNPRPAASYTYGYNPPVIVRKLAVLLSYLDKRAEANQSTLRLSGNANNGFYAAAAQLLRPAHAKIGTLSGKGIDFQNISSIKDANILPGALRFGGIQGLIDSAEAP